MADPHGTSTVSMDIIDCLACWDGSQQMFCVQQLAQQSGQSFDQLLEAAFQQLAASGQLDLDTVLAAVARGSAPAAQAPPAAAAVGAGTHGSTGATAGHGTLNGQAAAAAALRLVTNLPRAAPAASAAARAPPAKAAAAELGAGIPATFLAAAQQK